jgi:hypothetical protein
MRYEQLNLINKKRLAIIFHHQLFQQKMAKAYDKKVRPMLFQKGDLVLRKISPPPNKDQNKWAPNHKGPYIVKKVFSEGALLLTRMNEDDFSRLVNSNSIKKYHA